MPTAPPPTTSVAAAPPPSALDLECPFLPQTLAEAARMLAAADDVEADAVIALAERDPVLLAQLLTSLNSAYYGLSRTIASPARAVMLLGPVAVVSLTAGMSMTRLRNASTPAAAAASDRVVRHSLASAFLAQHLVGTIEPDRRPAQIGEAYTAGLLHDLGKLVLLHNAPDAAAALYGADEAAEPEASLFGCDHAEAGAVAAERSGFPEPLVAVIRRHHDAGALAGAGVDRAVGLLVRATAAASAGADALGFAAGPTPGGAGSDAAWAEVAQHGHGLPEVGGAEAVTALVEDAGELLGEYLDVLLAP